MQEALAMAAVGGAEELTEARRKLVAAEGELAAAKEELVVAKRGEDAQRIAKAEVVVAEAKVGVAKAEVGVAEAKVGVAEAKVGVAEAKVGVAEAKWAGAGDADKETYKGLLDAAKDTLRTAQVVLHNANEGLRIANTAYERTLPAAAPGEPPPSWSSPPHARAASPRPHRLLAPLHARWGRGGWLCGGWSGAVVYWGCVFVCALCEAWGGVGAVFEPEIACARPVVVKLVCICVARSCPPAR